MPGYAKIQEYIVVVCELRKVFVSVLRLGRAHENGNWSLVCKVSREIYSIVRTLQIRDAKQVTQFRVILILSCRSRTRVINLPLNHISVGCWAGIVRPNRPTLFRLI